MRKAGTSFETSEKPLSIKHRRGSPVSVRNRRFRWPNRSGQIPRSAIPSRRGIGQADELSAQGRVLSGEDKELLLLDVVEQTPHRRRDERLEASGNGNSEEGPFEHNLLGT